MTDKQIMIDGVNVAGCVRLQDDEISCDLGGECKGWENCYFKQLVRKTQECEQIKEKYEALKLENQEGYEIVAELEHEREELKERLERVEEDLKHQCVDCMNIKSDRYRKALEEIKKIDEPFCNACQEFEPEKKGSNCMYCNYGKILQKISECEVNND